MNALRTLVKTNQKHGLTRETYERFKEMLVKLMKRAPLSYTEKIFTLRDQLDQAFRIQSPMLLNHIEKEINGLRGSI